MVKMVFVRLQIRKISPAAGTFIDISAKFAYFAIIWGLGVNCNSNRHYENKHSRRPAKHAKITHFSHNVKKYAN